MNRSESLSVKLIEDLIGDFFDKVIQILDVIGGAIVGLVVLVVLVFVILVLVVIGGTIIRLIVVRAVIRFVLIVLIVVGAVIRAIIRFVVIRAEIKVIEIEVVKIKVIEIEVIKIYVIVDLSEFEIVLAFLRGNIVGFIII